jgi:hypothetical protein
LIVAVTILALLIGAGARPGSVSAQNVDYIGAGSGAALDLGFTVLVPSWVPAPFGGEPSIDAGGGSYSLYWMNGGGDPTFLQVTGVVGGALPAGSPYDLNNQLSINASVNGLGAIHDVTPIYDAVWWIQGGVLYSVQSRNMTGSDSLSLANSLIAFVPPVATEPEPEPTSPPVPDPDPGSDQGSDQGTGGDTGTDQSPDDTSDTGTTGSDEQASDSQTSTESNAGTSTDTSETDAAVTPAPAGSDGTGEPLVASDGTGGPPVEVAPSDGTGGGNDVVIIPRKTPDVSPTP